MRLTIFADEMPKAWAIRAYVAFWDRRRVLLHAGRFWQVTHMRALCGTYVFDITEVTPRRKSIDDCIPAEWDAASRAVRKTY